MGAGWSPACSFFPFACGLEPMETYKRLIADRSGASAAEYALLLAIIGTAIAVAAFTLGSAISNSLEQKSQDMQNCGGNC